jgi:hypothetical protein
MYMAYQLLHPTENLVSAPVIGFSPLSVGFLHKFFKSKLPKAASVKSAEVQDRVSFERRHVKLIDDYSSTGINSTRTCIFHVGSIEIGSS